MLSLYNYHPTANLSHSPEYVLNQNLQIDIDRLAWNPTIPPKERCGVLFQQTTLLDELTVAGNLCVALQTHRDVLGSTRERDIGRSNSYWT
jgi:ABC-type uncharacterized transport system YnjBCD ATPase subunit